jgi:poly(A) polymerase
VRQLREEGHEAVFAGGWVRDLLLGRESHDIDVATDATPQRVQEIFSRTVPVGAHFGVVLVIEGGRAYEVATFRSDGCYVDGRHPESVVFTDAKGDALRRDFTVNGLFYDPVAGEVIDHVGGRADLEAGRLRAIGDPSARFAEDRLRLLRAVRFAAGLGFEMEAATWSAVCAGASGIRAVSAERIREELVRMLTPPTRVRAMELLDQSGLLREVLPEVDAMHGCQQPPDFHPEGDVFVHTLLVLGHLDGEVSPALAMGALLHDVGKPPCARRDATGRIRFNGHEAVGAEMAEEILRRLRFSNQEIAASVEMVRMHMAFKDAPNMRVAKLRRFMARPTFGEELLLHRADCLGSHGGLEILSFLKERQAAFASEPMVPPRLVSGGDLLSRGWKPGPAIREALLAIQNLQLEGQLRTRDEALAWVDATYPQPR